MISIILPTFNNEKTIFYSIKSILNQSFKNFELIIINDCSFDKTKKIIKSFDDSRIVYLENKKNIGRAKSRNKGINKSRGNFIAVMDGDDISIPERLEIQIKYLIDNPDIDLVASNIIYFTDNKVIGISDVRLYKFKNINFYLRPIGLPHVTWVAKKEFFNNFQYKQSLKVSEDQELLLRSFNNFSYFLIKDPLVYVNIPKKNRVKHKLKEVYILFLARLRFINNNKLFYYFPIIIFIYLISSIFYSLGIRTNKILKNQNDEYQSLFDEIILNTNKK